LDQYISFNEQRQTLLDRKDSLDEDKSSIQELMDNLDMQKEQTILNTFNGVSGHFSDVFSELVPGGEGKLVMLTAADMQGEDGEDGDNDTPAPTHAAGAGGKGVNKKGVDRAEVAGVGGVASVSAFLGVQVKVSFSETSQQFEMKQLSGGQKALVALAIIFAIQR
jgi:structural maintenance of chromosome 3 (chondroitin sulfate proteoglycan 6)